MKVDVKNIKGEVIDNLTASDFIWKQPFWEMFYFLHPDNAVACGQYDYEL